MQDMIWQKSSFSGGGDSSNCVEIAATPEAILLRESDDLRTVLNTSRPQLAALIRHLRPE
ncbi:DUF397 domain-containing protein [Streptomyces sp. NPDC020298]|uniref:DUF397 domain-containing protein n=1 Tax=unclassified Streptomyces TaxID=2593676 RepID=UPI0033F7E68C